MNGGTSQARPVAAHVEAPAHGRVPLLPFHDFGHFGWRQRASVWLGLARIAGMRHLHQHAAVVQSFEAEFSRVHGQRPAIGLASGTDALALALRQAGAGPGTEVIVCPNTWVTTLTTIHEAGAVARCIDVDAATGLMDPQAIAAAVTPRTVAVLPVHMYGSMVPMDVVCDVARRAGLTVIEDACQAVGAAMGGRPAGTWGDLGCFSFHATKLVGAPGDGGLLLVRDAAMAQALRPLATAAWDDALLRPQSRVPSRLSPLQVPFLRARLRGLAARIRARAAQWRLYEQGLAGLPGLRLLRAPAGVEPSYRNCVVVSAARAEFAARCRAAGLPVEQLYPQSRDLLDRLCADGGPPLPQARLLARDHLVLPLGRQVERRHIDTFVAIARDVHC